MAPFAVPGMPEWTVDDATQRDFGGACCLVIAATLVSFVVSKGFDLHVGKALVRVDPGAVTLEQRLEATDKVLLTPLFAGIGLLALASSWELRATVEQRWSGRTDKTRACMMLYCAKMALDVPIQCYTLRKEGAKQVQMVGHHALSCAAIGLGLVTGKAHFFACWAVCSELSTPFLNLVMAIKLFGGNATPTQKRCHTLAGAALWLSYLPFRMALFPAWLYVWFDDRRAFPGVTAASPFELVFYPSVIAFLLALSTVWFVAISRGLKKALAGAGKTA